MVALRPLFRRRLQRGPGFLRTLPRLDRRRLQVSRDLRLQLARRQPIPRLIRLAPRPRPQGPLRLRQRLPLRLRQPAPALRRQPLRRGPAYHCGPQQRQEARLREHVQRRRLALRVLPADHQHYNAIQLVRERPALRRDNPAPVRRKACVRQLERRNNIVRAARRRAVPVVRPGSVLVDRLRDSRNALAAAVGRVAAITRDQ